jgi:hypothetical protein
MKTCYLKYEIELIMNPIQKKKQDHFIPMKRKYFLSPVHLLMPTSTKNYCTTIDQRQQHQNLQLILLVHTIYKLNISLDIRKWHMESSTFSSPKDLSEISVEVWWVWSHFIQWQALDLLMVRYVKLWFFWYSWMLHWPINQNKIIRQKVTKKMDLDSLQCKTHPQ